MIVWSLGLCRRDFEGLGPRMASHLSRPRRFPRRADAGPRIGPRPRARTGTIGRSERIAAPTGAAEVVGAGGAGGVVAHSGALAGSRWWVCVGACVCARDANGTSAERRTGRADPFRRCRS